MTTAHLSREDWLAVKIGAEDAARHGCRQPAAPREELGWFARAMLWLVGDDRPRALANPRLEAVRRFTCATRAGYRPSVALISELHGFGVMPNHLAAIAEFLV
ncbi:hypothetical protein [Novosphingobium nitrogenifigens]|nr:hypothetical protein [Novosphingobium nitrogenifigens]